MIRVAVFVAAALSACSPHRVTHNPAPPVPVPKSYGVASSERPLPEAWWRDFRDADLDRLVERGLEDSLQLRAAWARLRQAKSMEKQAASGKWPQIQFDASASRQKNRFQLAEPIGEITTRTNQFSASIGAAYEVDLWKRVGSRAAGARLDAVAFRDDVEAMAISMAAEIAEAWFDLVSQRAQRKLLVEQLRTNETFLELVRLRFEQGLASALDVYQQQQQVVATRAQLSLVEAAIAALGFRIATLVGHPPRTLVAGPRDTLPNMPPLPGTGIPADLLERRPDVRAARRRVEAADHRVAVAVADRLPGLRLSGSTSLQDSNVAELIATPLWAIIAAVTQPIFAGGRLEAEVERNRAIVEERLMQYGQVLLVAMTEVETALVQERQQIENIAALEEQVEIATSALREARARYREGLIDYLPVLTSLQALQRVELGVLQARRQLLSHRIQLCRALGGTWTTRLAPPQRKGGRK